MMSEKTIKTSGWILSILLAMLFALSAFFKISQNETAISQAGAIGLDAKTYLVIGVVEAIALILFLIPRTGLLGSLLLIAYMGGAIATHLQHQQPIGMTVLIEALLWITLLLRFPDLRRPLLFRGL